MPSVFLKGEADAVLAKLSQNMVVVVGAAVARMRYRPRSMC